MLVSILPIINAKWYYVLSEDPNVANNVAHSYLALTLGEDSYMSKSAINTWRGNVEDEAGQAKEIT